MSSIAADDPRLIWSGAISCENGGGWVKPWRIPYQDQDLYSPADGGLAGRAEMPSGVRLRFATDAQSLVFCTEALAEEGNFDLYADDEWVSTVSYAAGQTEVRFDGLAAGDKTVELWPSMSMPLALRSMELSAGADIEKSEDKRRKWVTYGSSITHCRNAGSPSHTWPGVVARAKGFNLTSLGYGGQCHADPMIARLIRDLDADFISIKIGINIYGGASLRPRAFSPAVIGTIATIRDGHPKIPLVVCSPIWSPERENKGGGADLTLEQMRVEVERSVEAFRRRGDANIYYVDGLKLFDASLAEYLPDNVHPDAEGYRRMGENFLKEVFEVQGVEVGEAVQTRKGRNR